MQLDSADQRRRGVAFAELHKGPNSFVIPNPWDAGTARLLTGLGFVALATTSAGLAHSLGRADGANLVRREEVLANARAIVAATHLPVSADLESGYGDTPEQVATTIRLAAEVGLVGGSIEDATGRIDDPIYSLEEAVERVQAAVEAARALEFPFTVTARAENYLHGHPVLADTITRLQAFEAAGADVLYAPGLPDAEAIRTVCSSVGRPVNVLIGASGLTLSVAELSTLGARRVSLGSALSRAALGAVLRAAEELRDHGTIEFAAAALPTARIEAIMSAEASTDTSADPVGSSAGTREGQPGARR